MRNTQLTAASGNEKTGPIPTTSRPMTTCPDDCIFLPTGSVGGCYGTGRLFGFAERAASDISVDEAVSAIEEGGRRSARYLRDRVVGDVVDPDGGVDMQYIVDVATVGRRTGLVPFGYTHAWRRMSAADVAAIAATGYVMNASCETTADVAHAVMLGMPATIVNDDLPEGTMIAGKRVVTCPEQTHDGVTCASCGLCAKGERVAVIRFLVHGVAHRKAHRAVAARESEEREAVMPA